MCRRLVCVAVALAVANAVFVRGQVPEAAAAAGVFVSAGDASDSKSGSAIPRRRSRYSPVPPECNNLPQCWGRRSRSAIHSSADVTRRSLAGQI